MFTGNEVKDNISFVLDDELGERYSDSKDWIPAINSTIDYFVSVFSKLLDKGDLPPEFLADLLYHKIYIPEQIGDACKIVVDFNTVWKIVGVEPNPIYETTGTPARDYYIGSKNKFAKYIPIQKWGHSIDNPFSAGNIIVSSGDFSELSYTISMGMDEVDHTVKHIMLRPWAKLVENTVVSDVRVGIWYLKTPYKISSIDDGIAFPSSVLPLFVRKVINMISVQHGQASALFQVTDKESKELLSLFI